MRYIGQINEINTDEYDHDIKEAVVTDERVAIDWEEGGNSLHLVARSGDAGRTYEGTYGAPRPDPACRVRLTRLSTFDDVPEFFAHWLESPGGDEFRSFITLQPAPRRR